MAPNPNSSDIPFLRNTGFLLVIATLVAGAITLSLTFREGRSMQMVQDSHISAPAQIVAASVEAPLPITLSEH